MLKTGSSRDEAISDEFTPEWSKQDKSKRAMKE